MICKTNGNGWLWITFFFSMKLKWMSCAYDYCLPSRTFAFKSYFSSKSFSSDQRWTWITHFGCYVCASFRCACVCVLHLSHPIWTRCTCNEGEWDALIRFLWQFYWSFSRRWGRVTSTTWKHPPLNVVTQLYDGWTFSTFNVWSSMIRASTMRR